MYAIRSYYVDCDVDAPNLYLFYKGMDVEKKNFYGGKKAKINKSLCIECEICEEVCKFGAIKNWTIDPFSCEGCGACTLVCPQNAIKLVDEKTADTFITKTDKGIISRAMMGIGSDGSGKLVTELRKNAKRFTENNSIVILDGSPGIGCRITSYNVCYTKLLRTARHRKNIKELSNGFKDSGKPLIAFLDKIT